MDKGFGILENILGFTGHRHKVLSSNVANADTPGYRAKDLEFRAAVDEEIRMRTTDRQHISTPEPGSQGGEITVDTSTPWGDGNNVELDMEMSKLTENSLLHQSALKLISKKLRMYRTAISGR
jgi:flagellar basal-body rod protein FlgB